MDRALKLVGVLVITVVLIVLGAVVAGIATMPVWDHYIADKAFNCTDSGFGSYWTDMDLHKSAGDTISPDWTWERLKVVRAYYLVAFWLLWAAVSAALFLIVRYFRIHNTAE